MTYLSSPRSSISKLIYQYELQTALYMLEPWEKALFSMFVKKKPQRGVRARDLTTYRNVFVADIVLFSIISLSVMTVFQYTPIIFNKLTA